MDTFWHDVHPHMCFAIIGFSIRGCQCLCIAAGNRVHRSVFSLIERNHVDAANVVGFVQLRQEKAQMLYSVEQVMQQKMAAQQQQQAENAAATDGGSVAS